jgi:hypothetical protein
MRDKQGKKKKKKKKKMLKGNKKSDGNKMKRDEVVSTTNLFSKLAGHVFKKHVNYTNLIQLNLTFKNVKS